MRAGSLPAIYRWLPYCLAEVIHVCPYCLLPRGYDYCSAGLVRGMLDDVTHRIGLIFGKGLPFLYLPSWVPIIRTVKNN